MRQKRFSAFQRRVYRVVCRIPPGEVRSYAWVAAAAGSPGAARAVGQALKQNPHPLIIPCHRVVASGGGLGGYSRGLALKRALLDLERQIKELML